MWEFDEFCDSIITKTTKTVIKNRGQVITSYKPTESFSVDIQPIEQSTKTKTWGNDIEATYQIYSDVDLAVDDVIVFKGKPYQVEKVIDWISYNIYAIKEVDVKIG